MNIVEFYMYVLTRVFKLLVSVDKRKMARNVSIYKLNIFDDTVYTLTIAHPAGTQSSPVVINGQIDNLLQVLDAHLRTGGFHQHGWKWVDSQTIMVSAVLSVDLKDRYKQLLLMAGADVVTSYDDDLVELQHELSAINAKMAEHQRGSKDAMTALRTIIALQE